MPARMFILGDRALLLVANPYYREGTRLRLPAGWRQQDGGEIALALPAVGTATLWLQR